MNKEVPGSTRPVIAGYYPDPTICRVGDKYYVANSSFELFPAVPIWESEDLITWKQVGNALDRPEQFKPGHAASNKGIYAPTLRFRDGKFWLVTTDVEGDGHVAFWAHDPEGPWSDPIYIRDAAGIDPDLAWDEEGKCYLTYCTSDPGRYEISQALVDLETGTLLEEPRVIWNGTGLQWPEGPHLYRVGSWWYLLIAEGGTERGHVISVARSKNPEGPFEGHPENPIFTHRSTDHPVFSVGHGDMVETVDGQWAMVYLGVRPRGYLPGHHVNGREMFLAGITWEEGWPKVDQDRYRVPLVDHSFEDRFVEGKPLDPRWVSPGHRIQDVATAASEGLVLRSSLADNGAPSGLGFRVRDEYWDIEVDTDSSQTLALRLRYDNLHWYEISVQDGKAVAKLSVGPAVTTKTVELQGDDVTLILRARESLTQGPDDIILAVRTEDGEQVLMRADGRYLSTETAGGFLGRIALIHSLEGDSRVKRVRYTSVV